MSQTRNFKKNVTWRPIHSLLTQVDNGETEKRLIALRDTSYKKSPAEISMQFNPTSIGEAAELQFSKDARRIEGIRNACVFAPLMLMLISLGIAAQAYTKSPQSTSSGGAAFFNLWISGFPSVSSVNVLGLHISLVSGHTHWFTFSDVLIYDFILLLVIVGLTVIVHEMEGNAIRKARELTVWLNEELGLLCDASSVRSLGIGPGSEQPEWAVHVHEAISHLHDVLQEVEGAVDISQKNFSNTIEQFTDVYNKQNLAVDKLLQGTKETEKTVDSLGGIYMKLSEASQQVADVLPRVSEQLSHIAGDQKQMTQHLQRMADDIHQLTQPFRAVGLAEMARQIEKQQKENLNFLRTMEHRLTQARTGGWFRKFFFRSSN